ncbi:MAG: flagellar protein FliT [Myxococcales bacterium]|nr:flagellar protein FliT [Myxococcales bacterium]
MSTPLALASTVGTDPVLELLTSIEGAYRGALASLSEGDWEALERFASRRRQLREAFAKLKDDGKVDQDHPEVSRLMVQIRHHDESLRTLVVSAHETVTHDLLTQRTRSAQVRRYRQAGSASVSKGQG